MTLHSTAPTRHRTLRLATALGGTALLAALALVSLMPAWSMGALPLVLATSELSPVLALFAVAWIPVARWLLRGRVRWRAASTLVLLVAAACTLAPLVRARRMAGTPSLASLPDTPDVRERDIRYAAADGAPLVMRLYRAPAARERRPIVVVLYGGAWRGGEPSQGARTSRALAQRGWVVAAIDYRHAPRFTHPAQLDDVRRSLALVRDSAASWNADPARIVLLGRSAGGHLAELAAYAPGDRPVQGVIAIYAPWDLAAGWRDVPVPDPIGVRGVIGNFVGGTPSVVPERYRDASPASYVRPGLPPTLLIFGDRDHLVKPEFNRAALAALQRAGVGVEAVELPWSEHGFDLVPGGLGERIAWGAMERFLKTVVGYR